MLSAASRPYIDASVPVLREHGLAITTVFYRDLFNTHPELKNLFNMGNQAQGTQQQSLAAAVFAYAANIDKADVLAPVINRIVHKHASLGIKAEHYPIVGQYLLAAIKETLGDAATAPLLDAWAGAYSLLAEALINEEKRLYAEVNTIAGELTEYEVTHINQESDSVRSFMLKPANRSLLPTFHPGQYVSVAVDFADGTRQLRQYSLSDAPEKPYLRISVKREARMGSPAGRVSNWLHDNVKVGDSIQLSPPFGDFLPNVTMDTPLVLFSAGVGITPMISALNQLALRRSKQHVLFAHAARNPSNHAHITDLVVALKHMSNLKATIFYETINTNEKDTTGALKQITISGEMQISSLPNWPLNESNIYLCGPAGFMKKQWEQLIKVGVPANQIHKEIFGPDMLENLM